MANVKRTKWPDKKRQTILVQIAKAKAKGKRGAVQAIYVKHGITASHVNQWRRALETVVWAPTRLVV